MRGACIAFAPFSRSVTVTTAAQTGPPERHLRRPRLSRQPPWSDARPAPRAFAYGNHGNVRPPVQFEEKPAQAPCGAVGAVHAEDDQVCLRRSRRLREPWLRRGRGFAGGPSRGVRGRGLPKAGPPRLPGSPAARGFTRYAGTRVAVSGRRGGHRSRTTFRMPAHRFAPTRGPYRIANGASSSP